MALARVVTFEGVGKERMDQMSREMQEGSPPEGLNPTEVVVLHDADAEKSLVIVFFDTEEDYRRGDGASPGWISSMYFIVVLLESELSPLERTSSPKGDS